MIPTKKFPEAKCRALRLTVADRMLAIEELFHFRRHDGWLRALLGAVRVCSAKAEGRVTDFVRRLGPYLAGVLRDGCLFVPEMVEQGLGLLVAAIFEHPGAAPAPRTSRSDADDKILEIAMDIGLISRTDPGFDVAATVAAAAAATAAAADPAPSDAFAADAPAADAGFDAAVAVAATAATAAAAAVNPALGA